MVLRLRVLTVPPNDSPHLGKGAVHAQWSLEITGKLPTAVPFRATSSNRFAPALSCRRSPAGSSYPCKEEWLKDDLSLKTGKGIKSAIEMVAKREFDQHSQTFLEASEQISTVRNATFHTDLTSDEDPVNAYYRWNASQALVEILLLRQMGLENIPNRTVHGTFSVMGKNMYEDTRKEELNFS